MMKINLKSDYTKIFGIVAVIALIIISVAYGITYIFGEASIKIPVKAYYIFFIFSIGFTMFSVFFKEETGAVYPRDLFGGAIASACVTFIITSAFGGIKYIVDKGLIGIGFDNFLYAFSISIILSLISYYIVKKRELDVKPVEFSKTPAKVIGIAFLMMITIVYGINYILKINPFPIPPSVILFLFAIGFVIGSIIYEKRGAIFPWHLLGAAIASSGAVFILTAMIGGIRYILEKGFSGLGADTVFYAFSICIILSMILYDQYDIIKEKL